MEQSQQSAAQPIAMHPLGRHRPVPSGFVGLRADFGSILRSRRTQGGYGKQATIAADIGIAAETLSRIENSRTVPRLETMQALLEALYLDWADVAVPDPVADLSALANTSRRRDRLFDAGSELRDARRHGRLSLRALAALCGISLAQLSRFERGHSGGAKIFCEHSDDDLLDRDDRRIVLDNPVLQKLVRQWRQIDE